MKKFWYSSRFWVGLFGLVVTVFITFQIVLGLVSAGIIVIPYLNTEIDLPISTIAYSWAVLVGIYCGTDRVVDITKTISMQPGQLSMGDLSKLRKIISLSLFFVFYSLAGTLITDRDFALEAFIGAFAAATIIYCAGNKLVKSFKYSGKDINNDGVPDDCQFEYDKWAREQAKKGTNSAFITFDYFLDENPELEKKYRTKN